MDDAPVTTRLATPDDAGVLAQLLWDFNAEFGEEPPPVPTFEQRLHALLAGDRYWGLLAGMPAVGFALVALRESPFHPGGVAYVEDLYVQPQMRGVGIGSALMELLLAQVRQRGIGMIDIGVDESDVDAMRFYERHGFIHRDPRDGERAFYIYRELD